MSDDQQESYTRGYYRKPHQLRTDCVDLKETTYKLVDFIADLTFGWGSRWVILSQNEILSGKRRPNGEYMGDLRSGLKDKKSIRAAVKDALERELIEVQESPWGTGYAIHRRYWGMVDFAPKWAVFGRIPHNPDADPIPLLAGGLNPPSSDNDNLLLGGQNPPASDILEHKQGAKLSQAGRRNPPEESPEAAPRAAPAPGKDTLLDTSLKDTEIDTSALPASPIGSPPAPVSINLEKEENEGNPQSTNYPAGWTEDMTQIAEVFKQMGGEERAGLRLHIIKQASLGEEEMLAIGQADSLNGAQQKRLAWLQVETDKMRQLLAWMREHQ